MLKCGISTCLNLLGHNHFGSHELNQCGCVDVIDNLNNVAYRLKLYN